LPKVEPFQNNYLNTLGREAVMQMQSRHAWYYMQFGFRLARVQPPRV
jgi:hypothetical protein